MAVSAPPQKRQRIFLGWTVVAVAALASFTEVAFFNPVLGVFIPEFEREFGWSRTEISAAVTLGSLVGAVIVPFAGPLIDRYGGKRFVAAGAAILAMALLALSFMQNEWQFFIIYAIGRGTAAGFMGLAGTVTVSKWFIRRRGLAIGVSTLGTRIGFAVMPIGVQLIISSAGWREACIALSMTCLTFGILPTLRWLHRRPEEFGLEPDGEPPPEVSGAPRVEREVSWTRHDAIRTRAFWLVTFSLSMQMWAGGAINLHQIPHLVDRGLSAETAALLISLVAVFSACGSLLEGVLDTTIGARWTFVIGLLGSSVGLVILMNVSTVQTGVLFAVIYGLAFGLIVASSQVVFADYFGREALGAIRGAAAPFQLCFNAAGPMVAGAAYDLTGDYTISFVIFTFAYLVSAVALTIARKPRLPSTRTPLPLPTTAA